MSDKLYIVYFTKEEIAYSISLFLNLKESINKIPIKKYKNENLMYMDSILKKLDKSRK